MALNGSRELFPILLNPVPCSILATIYFMKLFLKEVRDIFGPSSGNKPGGSFSQRAEKLCDNILSEVVEGKSDSGRLRHKRNTPCH